MRKLKGRVAAVTGAASGIGRGLAVELAGCGCHVAISDVNEKGLAETAEMVKPYGVNVEATKVDVANREEVQSWADATVEKLGAVHMIFNNAGVAMGGTVEQMDFSDIEWLMNINFWGVVYGTKIFLPYLKQQEEGHIVNISSIFGIVGVPTQSAYNAAKFAVRGFTESLRQELEIEESTVNATSVHPGGIRTNIASSARLKGLDGYEVDREGVNDLFNKMTPTSPEKAARIIVDGVRRNKARVLVGLDAKMIDLLQRSAPVGYQRFAKISLQKRYKGTTK